MSIKSIKEKELLVNFARAMGQAVDPKLAEEVDRINAIRNSVKASVSENIFKDLGAAVTTSKSVPTDVTIPNTVNYEPDEGALTADQLEQIQETVVPEIQFPVPPSLDELLLVLNEQIEEVKNELVQAQPQEEPAEAEALLPDTSEPVTEPVSEQTIADRTSDFISKSKDSFQQPDPLKVAPDIDAITKKLRFLEQWISKVSMAGPGGGEVKLRFLDDVDRSTIGDGKYLNYNESSGKFQFSTLTSGGAEADTLHTVTSRGNVTSNPITVRSANANYFSVNTSANYTVTTGQIAWNSADLTFDMGMANGVTLQVGQEQYIKVKAGSTITNGQAVMFAGANGEHIIAVPNNVSTPGYIPEWFIGIATQDIATNGFGYITTFGKVHNVNTLAWTEGDILYVDPLNVGELTNTEPQAPYPNIVVAAVTKRAGGDGHLMVRPTWRSDIHQLNDVAINGAVPGQVLVFDSGNVWHNQWLNTANVLESNGNLYYTNARVYANVIQLGFLTAANLNGLTNNTQLLNYATVANLNLKANIIDLSTYATIANLNLKANATDLFNYATVSNLNIKANVTDLTTANVSELTNLYYTNSRVYANVIQIGFLTQSNLTGLTNNTQLLSYATVSNLNLKANITDLTTSNIAEGSNLYYTNARVYANVISLLNAKANVTDLATANVRETSGNLYFTNARVVSALVNTTLSNLSILYTPATVTGVGLQIVGANTKGGTGYLDVLQFTNTSGGATNTNKFIRINTTGELQIINSAYTSQLLVLNDVGDLTIQGNITSSGVKSGYSAARPGFRVTGSGTVSGLSTSQNTYGALNSNNFAVDFNQGSYLNATNGVFTAPVAGLYQIFIIGRNAGNAAYSQLAVVKNATNGTGNSTGTSGGSVACMIEWAGSSTMNHAGVGTILKLAVGDTLALKVLAGTIDFDGNDNWSVAYLG